MALPKFPLQIRAGSVVVKAYRLVRGDGREVFTLSWHDGGRWRTQQFADFTAAKREGELKAARLAAGELEAANFTAAERAEYLRALELVDGVPLVVALEEWRKARELAGPDVVPACEQWAERHGGKAPKTITVGQAIDLYVAARKRDGIKVKAGADRTFAPKRATAVTPFREVFGMRPIRSITPDSLSEWLNKWEQPVTRNTHRKRIVALWRWCRKRGHLPLDVMTAAERTDMAKEDAGEIGLISTADLKRALGLVMESAPQYVAPLALAAFCGLRREEVHGQAWSDIDLKRGHLKVTAAKPNTPARRLVPLHPAAVAWLKDRKQDTGPVCKNLALDRIRRLCRKADLILVPNGFRHTYISAQVMITGDIPRVALDAGTSVKVIHAHYRELMRKDEAEAWFAVRP